jgi:hypothetical protein
LRLGCSCLMPSPIGYIDQWSKNAGPGCRYLRRPARCAPEEVLG